MLKNMAIIAMTSACFVISLAAEPVRSINITNRAGEVAHIINSVEDKRPLYEIQHNDSLSFNLTTRVRPTLLIKLASEDDIRVYTIGSHDYIDIKASFQEEGDFFDEAVCAQVGVNTSSEFCNIL